MQLAAEVGGLGTRGLAALLFIALAIGGIWLAFRHLQDLTEGPATPPDDPPPPEPGKPAEPPPGKDPK